MASANGGLASRWRGSQDQGFGCLAYRFDTGPIPGQTTFNGADRVAILFGVLRVLRRTHRVLSERRLNLALLVPAADAGFAGVGSRTLLGEGNPIEVVMAPRKRSWTSIGSGPEGSSVKPFRGALAIDRLWVKSFPRRLRRLNVLCERRGY
jgi:hypothetical protein